MLQKNLYPSKGETFRSVIHRDQVLCVPGSVRGTPECHAARGTLGYGNLVIYIEEVEDIEVLQARRFEVLAAQSLGEGPGEVLSKDLQVVGDRLEGQGRPLLWGWPLEAGKVAEEEATEPKHLKDAVLIYVLAATVFESLHGCDKAIHIPTTIQWGRRRCALPLSDDCILRRQIHQAPSFAPRSATSSQLLQVRSFLVQLTLLLLHLEQCSQHCILRWPVAAWLASRPQSGHLLHKSLWRAPPRTQRGQKRQSTEWQSSPASPLPG
mmetsp:Transcript_13470/g.31945  ORF Transcript_13470/g.31945 Transcript_13470/m.31945 type:complete len:266 (+) Transcript_13470:141-938(+)